MNLANGTAEPQSLQHQEATWAALDDPSEWGAFSEQNKNQAWESYVAIEGMHCAACGFTVEKALKSVPGVIAAEVNASTGRARVVWSSSETKPSAWWQAVTKAGYQMFPRQNTDNTRKKQQRLLLWRLLVAGFCMMQVMMYAYPAYVAKAGEISANTISLMRWASWVLTLPVLLFSSGPFFTSALNDIKRRQISMDLPVALGVLITFIVSSAATFEPNGWWGGEVYFDSLTMFVFFLLTGRWLEARMRNRTAGALEAVMQQLPTTIAKQNADGSFTQVGVAKLRVGDTVRVLPGEAFPADGEITLGETSVNEALLTGESHPVAKWVGEQVIAGSHNLSAAVQVAIKQVGNSTQYAQIVALMERVSIDKPRLALLADRVAKPFLLLVLIAAAGAAILLWPVDHGRALMAAVSVLIVTCPCALSLATPAAMLASAGALARKGVLVRHLQALEAIANATTFVFDKTGTLTKNQIKIARIQTAQGLSEKDALQLAASIAQHSLHPVSQALVSACHQPFAELSHVEEVAGAGLIAETPLGKVRLGSAKHCQVKIVQSDEMQLYMTNASGLLAIFNLAEEVREDAADAIKKLLAQGFNVAMLTGDKFQAAQRVAQTVGITDMQAECTPQVKLANMQQRQQAGERVVMVGDGLNDGPVLAGAHVSVAIGQAVPLAQAQSDFVIQGGQLSLLPSLVMQAKKTMKIVKQNLVWAALYNATCVPLAVMGYLPAWLAGLGMAFSSLLVILNALRLSQGIIVGSES